MSPVVENAGRNERSLIYANPIAMGDKATVLTNSQMNSQWAVWQEGASGGQLRRVIVGVSGAGVAADPAALGTNLIVPTSNGQLHVLDALSGQRKASPFIPTVEPGQNLGWNGPALGTDRKSVVVSDSLKRMYRIGLGPQLAKLSERDLDRPIKGVWSFSDKILLALVKIRRLIRSIFSMKLICKQCNRCLFKAMWCGDRRSLEIRWYS